MGAIVGFWLCCLLMGVADGAIVKYEQRSLKNNFLWYRKNAMYSFSDAPAVGKDSDAYISFDMKFEFSDQSPKDAIVQVSVFPADEYQYIGIPSGNSSLDAGDERVFCCTQKMADEGRYCSRPGALIMSEDRPRVYTDEASAEKPALRYQYPINEKGFYFLVISYCNDQADQVVISGSTRWKNPYGYLPGEVYHFMPFYYYMYLLYLFCACTWAYLCGKHWRDLLMIQNWMTVVIGFGLIEEYLRYYDFYHYNVYGERSKGILLSSIFFLCLKKTVSRILVLIVAMGYGVCKPTLGGAAGKIIMLGGAYFCFSMVQLVVENLNHNRTLTFSQYLLVLPVIALDFAFFLWVFKSISTVVESLQERRQDTKLKLYHRFRVVLAVCVIVGVAWSFFFSYANLKNWEDSHWETFYILAGFWDVLYFFVLFFILVLWAPTSNSTRYAYDKVDTWDHDDEEYGDELEDVVAVKGNSLA